MVLFDYFLNLAKSTVVVTSSCNKLQFLCLGCMVKMKLHFHVHLHELTKIHQLRSTSASRLLVGQAPYYLKCKKTADSSFGICLHSQKNFFRQPSPTRFECCSRMQSLPEQSCEILQNISERLLNPVNTKMIPLTSTHFTEILIISTLAINLYHVSQGSLLPFCICLYRMSTHLDIIKLVTASAAQSSTQINISNWSNNVY